MFTYDVVGRAVYVRLSGRGGPLGNSDKEFQIWNYTQEVLITTNTAIWDIAVSPHTGNIYVANFWINTLFVMKRGNVAENVRIYYVSCEAVDATVPQVYAGSGEGLRIYDETSGKVTKVTQVHHDVSKIFVPKNGQGLYIVSFYVGVFRYRNWFTEETTINSDVRHQFAVDHHDNYYFNSEVNYRQVTKVQLNGQNDTITFNSGPFDRLAVDNVGRVFGLFGILDDIVRTIHLLKTDGTTQVVANLDFAAYCMSFDGDNNVVFGTRDNKVIKLKFNECISPSTTNLSDTTTTSRPVA